MLKGTIIVLLLTTFILTGCSFGKDIDMSAGQPLKSDGIKSPQITIASTPTLKAVETNSPVVTANPTPDIGFIYIDDIVAQKKFATLYIGHWDYRSKTDSFVMNEKTYNNGLGMFILSGDIKESRASKSASWDLDNKYNKASFDLGSDQAMQYGVEDRYGKYRIEIFADGRAVYDSGYFIYKDVAENVQVDLGSECKIMKIELTQYKGSRGTLNVVLGNFKLYSN